MYDMKFPWSDNWWIEGDKAWFCAGEVCAIFCVDLNSGQCDLVEWIPECNATGFRLYSYCIKKNDIIFCIPSMAKSIWYYDMKKSDWGRIEVENEKQLLMCIPGYNTRNNQIWLLEDEKGRVFEINSEKKILENKYQLLSSSDMLFYEFTMIEDEVYCVNGHEIYCINSSGLHTYEISGIKTELCTVCYDNGNFWLSGYSKDIYIWNVDQGIIKVIEEFPKHFGFYHFRSGERPVVDCDSLFCDDCAFYITSIPLGQYIWYIPFRSDEIVYIDKDTYEVHLLEVEDEQETKESIENHIMAHKYLVQYIHENRYIGIYSLKNGWIFEIDTVELSVIKKCYELSDQAFLSIEKATGRYNEKLTFREHSERERRLFSIMLKEKKIKKEDFLHNVGESIYHTLND